MEMNHYCHFCSTKLSNFKCHECSGGTKSVNFTAVQNNINFESVDFILNEPSNDEAPQVNSQFEYNPIFSLFKGLFIGFFAVLAFFALVAMLR